MNLEEMQEMQKEIKEERAELKEALAQIQAECDLEQLMAEAKYKPRVVECLEAPYDKAIIMPLKNYEGKRVGRIVADRDNAIINYKGKRYAYNKDGKHFLQALGLYKREYAAVRALIKDIKQEKERQKKFWQAWNYGMQAWAAGQQ